MKNNLFRIKVEFEGIPIVDKKVSSMKEAKSVWNNFQEKFEGTHGR